MNLNVIQLHGLIRYFTLRPALLWSLVSFFVIILFLFMVRWDNDLSFSSYVDLSRFQIVEFTLQIPAETEGEIDVSDTNTPAPFEEKPLEFGNSAGEFSSLTEGAYQPRPIYTSLPLYPQSMRSAGTEGIVVIELGIDADGTVLYGKIVGSLGREFDLSAIEWVKKLKFYPALDPERRPFACRINLPIKFKLEH